MLTTPAGFAWLSVGTALVTMALKLLAWWLTGSVGLLADALESLVNLGGAWVAVMMLKLAAVPEDDGHPHGHNKAEYFASGFEGMLILVAGASILVAAVPRLFDPQPPQHAAIGLAVSGAATAINFAVSLMLARAALVHGSPALQADAAHLMTDVWTSVGIIAGVALVAATGMNLLDPIVAIAAAAHILWTGWRLSGAATAGLMDAAWPAEELRVLEEVLDEYRRQGIGFHAIRTRRAAARRFVSFHVLVPGAWTVQRGHDLLERIELELAARLPRVAVITHLEPIEDPASYQDVAVERTEAGNKP